MRHDLAKVLVTEAEWTALSNSLLSLLPYATEETEAVLRLSAENARVVADLVGRVTDGQMTPAELEVELQRLMQGPPARPTASPAG